MPWWLAHCVVVCCQILFAIYHNVQPPSSNSCRASEEGRGNLRAPPARPTTDHLLIQQTITDAKQTRMAQVVCAVLRCWLHRAHCGNRTRTEEMSSHRLDRRATSQNSIGHVEK